MASRALAPEAKLWVSGVCETTWRSTNVLTSRGPEADVGDSVVGVLCLPGVLASEAARRVASFLASPAEEVGHDFR